MERGGVVAVLPAPSQQSCRRHERQCLEIQSEDGSLDAQLGSGERERERERGHSQPFMWDHVYTDLI